MEKAIEKYLRDKVEKHGGKFLKFVSPGMAGVPDRILLFPSGGIKFIEMKDTGKKLEPLQVKRANELKALGHDVRCIDTKQKVNDLVKEVFG
ncbi:VRR-NUC domain-containing protein [Pelosinus sp. IPA-1]|uniref:VRR-NUC domain-containing protein n=1 Tax=Pelosinus sp. IPA-1 TaxID=3029569 RepID=UPI0024362309|nr:VRR-NUC domain-containing protein [Pelosinus sp. IPA-1]GMB00904.1 nuclease [Pelosinus sp. IPA-1]